MEQDQSRRPFISLDDLYIAYRKAKVDAFYERDHTTSVEFAEYEQALSKNLQGLLNRLSDVFPDWQRDDELVGHFTYIPKKIKPPEPPPGRPKPAIISEPDAAWRAMCHAGRAKAEFRIVGRHPVDFHVISTLWIQKVGHKFDSILSKSAYASRVRRMPLDKKGYSPPCASSLGSFHPYSYGFRNWRSEGLSAMQEALKAKKSVIAVTADLQQFYHQVSPSYLTSPIFLNRYNINLSEAEHDFTEKLIEAFHTWAQNTPRHQSEPKRGLPVGLSAPRLIANVLMHPFDEFIKRELSPIYYGRYVDDVFLILENTHDFKTFDDVWDHLIARANSTKEKSGLAIKRVSVAGETGYQVILDFSALSLLIFIGAKQKVFALTGSSGESLLASVINTITKRSSDWRLLPDLPSDEEELVTDFLNAGKDASEEVDNLRKADGITVQRLAFALRLRNFEAVRRDLEPSQWISHRKKFYQIVLDHVITAQGIFAYSPYIARLVSLAVASGDWDDAAQLVTRLADVLELVRKTSDADEFPTQWEYAYDAVMGACYEATVKGLASFRGISNPTRPQGIELLLRTFSDVGGPGTTPEEVERTARLLLQCDLGYDPYREHWINGYGPDVSWREPMIVLPESVRALLDTAGTRDFLSAANFPEHSKPKRSIRHSTLPRAVVFPTRPFTTAEISLLDQKSLRNWKRFRRWVTALRGTQFDTKTAAAHPPLPNYAESITGGNPDVVSVPNGRIGGKPLIALPAFWTSEGSWDASVLGMLDPDSERYFRINRLINDTLKSVPRPDYVVLPELALPRKWFNLAAHRLAHSGVSLIAGVEYEHHGMARDIEGKDRPYVSNQVWASLVTDLLGYQSLVIYEQEKERPAPEEEDLLRKKKNKTLKPLKTPVQRSVVQHDDFHFGVLICSELTNIELRGRYRGLVDALIVPEWNKDINSFSSLVESAALDVHCFVIQVNNRQYGDCRVRAPYKEEFRRDVARVKGGKADYYVLAELDVPALRSFQTQAMSPSSAEFKPKPDGYEINPRRKRL